MKVYAVWYEKKGRRASQRLHSVWLTRQGAETIGAKEACEKKMGLCWGDGYSTKNEPFNQRRGIVWYSRCCRHIYVRELELRGSPLEALATQAE